MDLFYSSYQTKRLQYLFASPTPPSELLVSLPLDYRPIEIGWYLFFSNFCISGCKVTRLIQKSVTEQSSLLKGLMRGQTEQELQKRVTAVTRNYSDKLTDETGISPSLTDDKVKQYMHEVLREVRREK